MYRCQQNKINPDRELKAILEYICSESNKIHNCATYYARQLWMKKRKIANRAELCSAMVNNPHFGAMYVSASQQTCHTVAESFRSFIALLKAYNKGTIREKPSLPKYRKSGGLNLVSYPIRWLKLTEEGIRVPLGKKVKAWFGLNCFYLPPMPSNLRFQDLKEIRILPRNQTFYVEFIYWQKIITPTLNNTKALGIDPGVTNWLSCVDNLGNSFIVDGKQLKSKNQWYNKRVAVLKANKPQGFWSKQLALFTEKRNRQMRDAVNKAARMVINHCLKYQIGIIVFGWNKQVKQSVNLGTKNNQSFVQIPTSRLKERINQLCKQYGIEFIETEESYTSQSSFLDGDFLPIFGAKPEQWKPLGKRIKRGLYQTAKNWLINADCLGAVNALKKVATTLGIDLNGVSRGTLTMPLRIRFWRGCGANSVRPLESPVVA